MAIQVSAFDWTTYPGILTAILVLALVWFEWKLVRSRLRWRNQDKPAEAEVEYADLEQEGRDEDTLGTSPVHVEHYYISSDSSDAELEESAQTSDEEGPGEEVMKGVHHLRLDT